MTIPDWLKTTFAASATAIVIAIIGFATKGFEFLTNRKKVRADEHNIDAEAELKIAQAKFTKAQAEDMETNRILEWATAMNVQLVKDQATIERLYGIIDKIKDELDITKQQLLLQIAECERLKAQINEYRERHKN